MSDFNFRYVQTTRSLSEINLSYKVQIDDLGNRQRQEEEMITSRQSLYKNNKIYDLENYHSYEEVNFSAWVLKKNTLHLNNSYLKEAWMLLKLF